MNIIKNLVRGVIPIRRSSKKLGLHKSILWLSIKMLAVWYLLLGISASFNGETNAHFSSQAGLTGNIRAGKWETDCLDTPGQGEWDCSSVVIEELVVKDLELAVTISNQGSDMKREGKYAIYYIESGDPQNGKAITKELPFNALKEGETIKLTYTAEKNGMFIIKIYQHPDHPEQPVLWSKAIQIDSIKDMEEEAEETIVEEQTEEEAAAEETKEEAKQEEKTQEPEPTKEEEKQETKQKIEPEKPASEEQEKNAAQQPATTEQGIEKNEAGKPEAEVKQQKEPEKTPEKNLEKEEKAAVSAEIMIDEKVNKQ